VRGRPQVRTNESAVELSGRMLTRTLDVATATSRCRSASLSARCLETSVSMCASMKSSSRVDGLGGCKMQCKSDCPADMAPQFSLQALMASTALRVLCGRQILHGACTALISAAPARQQSSTELVSSRQGVCAAPCLLLTGRQRVHFRTHTSDVTIGLGVLGMSGVLLAAVSCRVLPFSASYAALRALYSWSGVFPLAALQRELQ
jgi:hypothetical protein